MLVNVPSIDLNIQDDALLTPLHIVAQGGAAELAQILISHGADVNLTDKGAQAGKVKRREKKRGISANCKMKTAKWSCDHC